MIVNSGARPQLSRLDLWVAASMPADAALFRALARAGVGLADARVIAADAEASGIQDGVVVSGGAERVVEVFGEPAVVGRNQLRYDLTLWPAHQFVWAVSRWGDAGALGMRLRDPMPLMPARAIGLERARASFLVGHHTEHEVRCALGAPDWDVGVGPRTHRWLYELRHAPHCLELTFGWALLCDIAIARAPRTAPRAPRAPLPRTSPWRR
jgi:hypothetical protein